MENDLIGLVVRVNLALAAGIAVVLLLRAPARRWFGARVAYFLWLLPVLAAGACFLPPRIERLMIAEPLAPVSSSFSTLASVPQAAIPHLEPVVWLIIWCVGCVLSVAILTLRQGRFSRALGRLRPRNDLGAGVFGAESCTHGPAVIGVLRPIIVTPADFDQRFSNEERRIVLAHERAHLAQGDPLINALVVTLQCASWFNPFVHLGARALRLDQELAADATVLATSARRTYAEAILKTQIMAAAPLGAAWPPNSAQSLKERITMLKRTLPSRTQRLLGVSSIALVALGVCAAAWAAQPARVVVAKSPHIARADAAPFIEPPVSDAAMLAGAPATDEQWRLAQADHAAQDDYAKTADHNENVDDASVQSDETNVDEVDDTSDGDAVVINGDQVSERHLTPEERAQVRAAVAQARAAAAQARVAARAVQSQAVREAMAQARAAAAEARVAAREAQAEGMQAAREAQVEAVRSAVAVAREVNSPEMQAEIRAVTAQAAQLAHNARLTDVQREQMRAELRAHADRLRTLARAHRDCPQSHDEDDSHDN
ncbi:MAG: M56 family metallopeptidase [Vitreimonas sp.]